MGVKGSEAGEGVSGAEGAKGVEGAKGLKKAEPRKHPPSAPSGVRVTGSRIPTLLMQSVKLGIMVEAEGRCRPMAR